MQSEINIDVYAVDDDQDQIEFMRPHLEKVCPAGRIHYFTDWRKFLNELQSGVHISILDYRLTAEIDGIELGKLARKKSKFCFLIFLTAQDDFRTVQKAMNSGFQFCISKNDTDYLDQLEKAVADSLVDLPIRMMDWQSEDQYQQAARAFIEFANAKIQTCE